MKDQYFGDINDYLKYGLLREIARQAGLQVALCWLLTPNDGGSDGRRTTYLEQAARYRDFDPELFDVLGAAVVAKRRAIKEAERLGLIPGAWYYDRPLEDDVATRKAYFDGFVQAAPAEALIFFDPDNGLEVASVATRSRRSLKHLYFDEVAEAAVHGTAVVLYQHFPRFCDRPSYLSAQAQRIQTRVSGDCVAAVATSSVAFFLIAQGDVAAGLTDSAKTVAERWEKTVKRGGGPACTFTRFKALVAVH